MIIQVEFKPRAVSALDRFHGRLDNPVSYRHHLVQLRRARGEWLSERAWAKHRRYSKSK